MEDFLLSVIPRRQQILQKLEITGLHSGMMGGFQSFLSLKFVASGAKKARSLTIGLLQHKFSNMLFVFLRIAALHLGMRHKSIIHQRSQIHIGPIIPVLFSFLFLSYLLAVDPEHILGPAVRVYYFELCVRYVGDCAGAGFSVENLGAGVFSLLVIYCAGGGCVTDITCCGSKQTAALVLFPFVEFLDECHKMGYL